MPCANQQCDVLINNTDKKSHWLYYDQSTTDDSEDEADVADVEPHAEESDEEKSDEEKKPVFKTPEKDPPKKTRKSKKERVTAPTRQ